MKTYKFKLSANVLSIPQFHEKFNKLAGDFGLSDKDIFDLCLASEEIMSNIIFYGYNEAKDKYISIEVSFKDESVIIVFIDTAKHFDPTQNKVSLPQNKNIENIKIGGLGVYFVNTLMDRIEYQKLKVGNKLLIEKKIRKNNEN
ncbi:MAG: ATP-binding protein [Hyphomicrobiales bacterium]